MAKKLLIGLGALLLVAVAAVLVAPSFIDWGQYRGRIAEAAEDALGRRLDIGGDLSLSLLPLPTLVAEDVRLANLAEGSVPDMARVAEVRVRVSLPDLLGGNIRVESIRLVEPVVVLERLPSGRANWTFEPPPPPPGPEASPARGPAGGPVAQPPGAAGGDDAPPLDLRLDHVEIVDGRVLYRDPGAGVEEAISDIDVQLSAQSLTGPFKGQGSLVARDLPVRLEAAVGALDSDRAAPLRVDATALEGAASLRFSGLLTSGDGDRMVRGDLALAADRLPALLATAGLPEPPPALARAVALEGALSAGAGQATLDNVSLRLGDAEARGSLSAAYGGEVPRLEVDLSVSSIDVAKWMTVKEQPATEPTAAAVPAPPEPVDGGEPVETAPAPTADDDDMPALTLPTGIEVALDLRAEAVAWRGGVVRQAHLAADLANGELTLHELTGQMPGNSSVGVFGFVGGGPEAPPRLDLTVQARSDNLRAALEWLGIDVSQVPGGRLTQFQADARVGGTPSEIRLRNLDARVDTTTLRGAATILPAARPAFGLTLKVGSLNLDAYFPPAAPTDAATPAPAPTGKGAAEQPDAAPAPGEPALLAGLDALNGFDANFRLDAETVIHDGVPYHDVHAEGSLVGGRLTVKDTGVGQVMGGSLSLNGALSGFGGVPRFDGLGWALAVAEPARFARGFQIDLPVPADRLGRVSWRGTVSGTPADLTLDTRLQAANGTYAAEGVLQGLGGGALAYDLALRVTHPDTAALLSLAAPGYRPRGPLGALALASQVSGQGGVIALSGLDLSVGEETLRGDATVDLTQARPFVQATLAGTRLTVHRYLPAEQQAWLGVPGLVPAATGAPVQLAAAAERWSREPLDLAALRAVDMALTLSADSLIYETYSLAGADLEARLAAGRLEVPRLNGSLFGGGLVSTATLDASGEAAQASLTATLEGFQLGQALAALDAGKVDASGVGRLELTAATTGSSEAALVSALDGQGTVTVRRLTVQSGGAQQGIGAILGPIGALNALGGLGQKNDAAGTLEGAFTIEDGIVRFTQLTVDSNLYGGEFQGTVDLPRWTIDMAGQARMADNLLTGLLGQKVKLPKVVPVAVSGPLDGPRVRMDTGRATAPPAGEGSEAPQATQPLSPEEALPQLLDQVLGTGRKDAPAEGAPEGQDSQPAPAEEKPEKVLRGLLKGLIQQQ